MIGNVVTPVDFVERESVPLSSDFDNVDGRVSNLETQEDVYDRVKQAVSYSIDSPHNAVVDAPPSAGKSYSAAQLIAEKGIHAAYFTARRELYEEFKTWCEDRGLRVKVLPSMPHDCESYSSGSPHSTPSKAYNLYHRGMSPSSIHRKTDACEESCEYMERLPELNGEERAKSIPLDNYDVLIGHTTHSHVEPYIRGRTVFFDDISKLAFIERHEVTDSKLNAILENDLFPCSTTDEIYQALGDEESRLDAIEKLEEIQFRPWDDDDSTTHGDAYKIVETLLKATELDNGFAYYQYDADSDEDRRSYIGVKDGDGSVHLMSRPQIGDGGYHDSPPDSVIVLNGYPITYEDEAVWINWRLGIDSRLVKPLLEEERKQYYREIMDMSIIQTTQHIKPYSSGEHVAETTDSKLIKLIAREHDKDVPIISTLAALDEFDESELPISDKMNFASVESNNRFKDEDVGVVIGSPEWKIHQKVKLVGAFMMNSLEWNGGRGLEKSFGDGGNPIMKAFREDMVGQAILRFGRDQDIDDTTVYVHTSAIPEDIPVTEEFDEDLGGSYTSTAEQIRRYMSQADGEVFETSKLYDNIEATNQHVRKELKDKELFRKVEDGAGPKPSKWSLLY